jgi:hypothetical protein
MSSVSQGLSFLCVEGILAVQFHKKTKIVEMFDLVALRQNFKRKFTGVRRSTFSVKAVHGFSNTAIIWSMGAQ